MQGRFKQRPGMTHVTGTLAVQNEFREPALSEAHCVGAGHFTVSLAEAHQDALPRHLRFNALAVKDVITPQV